MENPLRMLRSGHLPVVKTRSRTATIPSVSHLKAAERRSTQECTEMSKSGIKTFVCNVTPIVSSDFVDCNLNKLNLEDPPHNSRHSTTKEFAKEDENPIPLPPRNRSKPALVQKPRHVRKHPLIIPPSSIQRTLDKVTIPSPSSTTSNENISNHCEPMYANDLHRVTKHEYDTASLHFEAQIEKNLDALDHIPQEQDCVDGPLQQQQHSDDEVAVQSHHVSCEDLLKFANAKPSSRARGNESDEVRLMFKVLGNDVRI